MNIHQLSALRRPSGALQQFLARYIFLIAQYKWLAYSHTVTTWTRHQWMGNHSSSASHLPYSSTRGSFIFSNFPRIKTKVKLYFVVQFPIHQLNFSALLDKSQQQLESSRYTRTWVVLRVVQWLQASTTECVSRTLTRISCVWSTLARLVRSNRPISFTVSIANSINGILFLIV